MGLLAALAVTVLGGGSFGAGILCMERRARRAYRAGYHDGHRDGYGAALGRAARIAGANQRGQLYRSERAQNMRLAA